MRGNRTKENGMNYTYAAMNKLTGVSLTKTRACSFSEAYNKATILGLDMNVWVICKV
jgi:hypothetical protein